MLQIPAFLCRQTDLIQSRRGDGPGGQRQERAVPLAVGRAAHRRKIARRRGARNSFFTERGVTFGYQNLVADMRSLYWMRQAGYFV